MYAGSLQNRIAEKNLKENIHTKIEQNQKQKKQKSQNYGAGSKVFVFWFYSVFFLVFWSHTNFFHGKDGFSTKNQKHMDKDGLTKNVRDFSLLGRSS